MHISVFSCLDDLVYKNRYIRSDVSRYSFPGIRDTYMMHFEPEHIFENGEMVHKYELPVKTVVSGDGSAGEQWQYRKFQKKNIKKIRKKNFKFFFSNFFMPVLNSPDSNESWILENLTLK